MRIHDALRRSTTFENRHGDVDVAAAQRLIPVLGTGRAPSLQQHFQPGGVGDGVCRQIGILVVGGVRLCALRSEQHVAVVVIDAVQGHCHDPGLGAAVLQREVDPHAVVFGQLGGVSVEEAAARLGVVDHLRFGVREAVAWQRYQQQLPVVLQQHLRLAAAEPLHYVSGQGPDEMGRQFMRAIEDLAQQSFPEALGAIRAAVRPSSPHPP
ncbi:hypothetical protein ACSHXN_47260 (plasmid) [Streptomyces sp. HUAS TT11]|uniref:hypothetical protein n=1 Tax=Streptomyces sp. HUAS TT11 TaxID=3447508 RepID=UPI003F654B15